MSHIKIYSEKQDVELERMRRHLALSPEQRFHDLVKLCRFAMKMAGRTTIGEPQGKGIVMRKIQKEIDGKFEFIRLASLLHKHHVKFMVVGGFAVNHYGYKRTTSDIDVYIQDSVENRSALIDSLDEMGYGRMEPLLRVPILAGYCEIMMDDGFYVDLMTAIPGLDSADYDQQYERKSSHVVDGVEIPYINYKDLLLNKEKTGRPKDQDDKDNLERVRQELDKR